MNRIVRKILVSLTAFVLLLSFTGASNVSVHAQNANIGFAECNFSGSGKKGPELIQGCLKSIFTFSFVIALFLIAFRVGFNALDDYNPFSNGNAVDDAVSTVWEVAIGLVLIGGPVLFLNTVNTSLLNFDFLSLGNLSSVNQTGKTPQQNTGTAGTNTTGTFDVTKSNDPSKLVVANNITQQQMAEELCKVNASSCNLLTQGGVIK